jgi:hypothetical protein
MQSLGIVQQVTMPVVHADDTKETASCMFVMAQNIWRVLLDTD